MPSVSVSTMLQLLGGVTALSLSYKLASFLHLYLRPSSLPRYQHGKPNSTWALVTGSTDGIGHGFALALCASGFNVLLHGRNPTKLAAIKAELEQQHPHLQIQTVVADAFEYDNDAAIDNIVTVAKALPGSLTILINNVGGAPVDPPFAPLSAVDSAHADNLLNLNARFPTQLTRALLPTLTSNSPSLVLNITSMLARTGVAYLTVYSAAKAFNHNFSQTLGAELRADGHADVEVLGIVVGNVVSGRNRERIPLVTCDSLQMAREALARVGCGRPNVWGWWRHAVMGNLLDLLPARLIEAQSNQVMQRKMLELGKEE